MSDAFGLRLVNGEIPGCPGRKGCVVSHVFRGSVIEASGELREGDEVLQINRIPMAEKSDEEIQLTIGKTQVDVVNLQIMGNSFSEGIREEMELVARSSVPPRNGDHFGPAMSGGPNAGYSNHLSGDPGTTGSAWMPGLDDVWPSPRSGQVPAKKALEDDQFLLSKG